jgi:hypothetical protein
LWGIPDGALWCLGEAPGMDVVDAAGRLCALALLADREEVCPGEACPLWEDRGCAVERLAAEGELYVDAWPEDDPAELRRATSNR